MQRFLWLGLVAFSACNKPSGTTVDFSRKPVEGASGGTWVARFNGDTLTDAEVQRRFLEMSTYARARYQTVEQRREYVEGLARFELLAAEAVRQGLANDPDVVQTAKQVMVQKLLAKELDAQGTHATDADVKAYYDAHTSDYVKPAMTRLAHIAFSKEHRAKAEETLAQALKLPPLDYSGFGALAKANSEDPKTQVLEGDMRFLSDEELTQKYGAEVTAAAAKLLQVGEVAPQLVETSTMLHVLKLQGRQMALNLSMEQARPSIQALLHNEAKQAKLKALLDGLRARAKYEVNDAALSAMQVDMKAAAQPIKGPQPGYVP